MPFWCAAQLQPARVNLAIHFLEKIERFKIYAPRIASQRVIRNRRVEAAPLLFPGYLFVWIELQWWRARWAPGVARLVAANGGEPLHVPSEVIADLRRREGANGLITLPKPSRLARGDHVRVVPGRPFAGRLGLYQGQRPHQRVLILLQALGAHVPVTLPAGDVEAV